MIKPCTCVSVSVNQSISQLRIWLKYVRQGWVIISMIEKDQGLTVFLISIENTTRFSIIVDNDDNITEEYPNNRTEEYPNNRTEGQQQDRGPTLPALPLYPAIYNIQFTIYDWTLPDHSFHSYTYSYNSYLLYLLTFLQ